ncbi:MAG: nucleotide exchange factor GrpE [Blastocatellia bacterium]|nr:nucleotide exchange factor GrpE [Blastocatellia bacterium]
MSSKQEAGQTPAQESAPENPEIQVTDKRRFSPEGEPVAGDPDDGGDPVMGQAESVLVELEFLRAQLRAAEEKRAEAERKVAEFADRFRKAQEQLKVETDEQRARMQRTFEQRLATGRGDIVASLLDTLDNLKRALAAAEKSEKRETDFDVLLEGLRATAGLFEAKMVALGLSAVPSVGEEFNPELHEAVELVVVPADQDNKVIEEYQTGYKFGDRLLRPARVRVGRAGN